MEFLIDHMYLPKLSQNKSGTVFLTPTVYCAELDKNCGIFVCWWSMCVPDACTARKF